MSRLAGGLLPHKQMPSRRSKNVVQVTANLAKSETKSEKIGEKRFASFCHKLPFSSGLGRLRQDLVNLVPRLEGRRSIRLSYGRSRFIDSKPFVLRVETFLGALTLCSKGRRYNQLNYGHTAQPLFHQVRTAISSNAPPSTLGPFGPDGARSDGISKPKAIREI